MVNRGQRRIYFFSSKEHCVRRTVTLSLRSSIQPAIGSGPMNNSIIGSSLLNTIHLIIFSGYSACMGPKAAVNLFCRPRLPMHFRPRPRFQPSSPIGLVAKASASSLDFSKRLSGSCSNISQPKIFPTSPRSSCKMYLLVKDHCEMPWISRSRQLILKYTSSSMA